MDEYDRECIRTGHVRPDRELIPTETHQSMFYGADGWKKLEADERKFDEDIGEDEEEE